MFACLEVSIEHIKSSIERNGIMGDATQKAKDAKKWFVLRDLTRSTAKLPGYMRAQQAGFEVFTPMKWAIREVRGKKTRKYVPAVHDLLFVYATKEELNPLIAKIDTLQYRFMKGQGYCVPMTVRTAEMDRFIAASKATDSPQY